MRACTAHQARAAPSHITKALKFFFVSRFPKQAEIGAVACTYPERNKKIKIPPATAKRAGGADNPKVLVAN